MKEDESECHSLFAFFFNFGSNAVVLGSDKINRRGSAASAKTELSSAKIVIRSSVHEPVPNAQVSESKCDFPQLVISRIMNKLRKGDSMYKMIVSDLDESLLNDAGQVSERDRATILRLQAQQVKFVPNTGRGFASVQALLKTIGTYQQPDQYVISYNGGVVVANQANQILRHHYLPFAVADQLYRLALAEPDLGIHLYTVHHVYVRNLDADEVRYIKSRGVDVLPLTGADLSAFAKRPIVKIIMKNLDPEKLAAFRARAERQAAEPLTVTYSSNRYVEFNPANVNKGSATLELGQALGIKPEEIIALGDNDNDFSMIQAAGCGVAVQNAVPHIKEAANLILTANNNQDPITEIYHRLFQ